MVEPVAETLLTVSFAVSYIGVTLALLALECAALGNVVAVFHRHFLSWLQRGELDLQPPCDDASEVDEPRAVGLPYRTPRRQGVDDAVALKRLRCSPHVIHGKCPSWVPYGRCSGIQPLAAESQRRPSAGVTVAA